MRRTALISDRRFLLHFAGRSHPERPERAAVMIEMAERLHREALLALSPREASVAELELFAQSLAPDDQVALEASGPALAIKRIIEPTSHASWSPTRERCARSQRRR